MKVRLPKLVVGILASAALVLLLAPPIARAGVQDFEIPEFKADYRLNRSDNGVGELLISESITAEFPQTDQNHGILRAIPKVYGDYSLKPRITYVKDGQDNDLPYSTYSENNNLVLKIGDANTFVHGRQTYKISYKVKNVIKFYEDHDELFWDINGTGWQQKFGNVTAVFHIPNDLASAISLHPICYTGVFGSKARDCTITTDQTPEETTITSTAENLGPGETLSVVIGFEPGTFNPDPWQKLIEQIYGAIGIVAPIVAFSYMYRRWNEFGRDPKGKGIIIPEYSPPKALSVLDADVLLNERFRPSVISAAIIELATSGYIKIHEVAKKKLIGKSNKYELELVKQPEPDLDPELRIILNAIFSPTHDFQKFEKLELNKRVNINDMANKLYETSMYLQKILPDKLAKKGYFIRNPVKVRVTYLLIGFMVFVSSFFVAMVVENAILFLGVMLSGIIIMLFSNIMPARTRTGLETRDALLGLKEYMKLAEAERIKYLQSPEGVRQFGDPTKTESKLNLYEKLLPYAMLFGIEKQWAKQFEHLYTKPPEWFDSQSGDFSPVYFANSLKTFSAATSSAFSPPSSSSSSGFSGGGAGGGGGGGGGGGW